MRPRDQLLHAELTNKLRAFDLEDEPLPGLGTNDRLKAFVFQLIESIRRIKYISLIQERNICGLRDDTSSELFDPLKASIIYKNQGNLDDAFWLIFIAIHTGKHKTLDWCLARELLGGRSNTYWSWNQIRNSITEYKSWLHSEREGFEGKFGNHRKYENTQAYSPVGTGSVIESYVEWILSYGSHNSLIERATYEAGEDPRVLFEYFYDNMHVKRFGRTGKFDYLTMLGKIGLVKIVPPKAYINGSTGPSVGTKLIFTNNIEAKISSKELEEKLQILENKLGLDFGMQVLEDALCNWQKAPEACIPFRG